MFGVLAALGALISWGFGDFSIQRATRVFGDIRTLIFIGLAGIIGLFPFVHNEVLPLLFDTSRLMLLSVTGLVIFVAAILDFEALKEGKIAVVEPVLAFELPVAVALAAVFLGERLTPMQFGLAAATFGGIVLSVTKHRRHLHYHERLLEPGVLLAVVGSFIMGGVNFLVGVSSQQTSPMLAIWFTNVMFTVLSVGYLTWQGELQVLFSGVLKHPGPVIAVCVLDNMAWVFYAAAASLIPIAIATTISESYVALAVLLGLFINKEKLERHQLAGVIIVVVSVLVLSLTVG
jgi:bacterial/archaeal transporter family protein